MNIMGMGWQEMMIIAVGALLIFGPDRLPEVAGQVGKFVRDLRKMTGDLTGELERTAGVGDIKKAVQSELGAVQNELKGVSKSVQGTVSGATSGVNKSLSGATSSVKSATASKGGTSAVSSVSKPASTSTATTSTSIGKKADAAQVKIIASKKDPLADFAAFEEPAAVTKAAPVAAASAPAASNGGSAAANDALGRARQRRVAAGYNRRAS